MSKKSQIALKSNPITEIVTLAPEKIEEFKLMVKQTMPEFISFVENKEDLSNSMYASSQEMWLAIDDVLTRLYQFDALKLNAFHNDMKDILTGTKEFEDAGLNIMTPHSMEIVGDKIAQSGLSGLLAEIAEIKYNKERVDRIGLANPVTSGAKPFLKILGQKNRGK